jgi:hypothetical protein
MFGCHVPIPTPFLTSKLSKYLNSRCAAGAQNGRAPTLLESDATLRTRNISTLLFDTFAKENLSLKNSMVN